MKTYNSSEWSGSGDVVVHETGWTITRDMQWMSGRRMSVWTVRLDGVGYHEFHGKDAKQLAMAAAEELARPGIPDSREVRS